MTPEQMLKCAVLLKYFEWQDEAPPVIDSSNVDDLYDEKEGDDYCLQDARGDVRVGEVETGLPAPSSRHYESKEVAAKVGERWIGWTYWYGGGKHGEPEAIDWMEDAYELSCVEEEELVVVRTFARLEA
jgi:hypothetical protein